MRLNLKYRVAAISVIHIAPLVQQSIAAKADRLKSVVLTFHMEK
ncbi:hypothetical protein XNW1_760008 [Xenorhabdus nematophila str. Websteri]|nr:hypothetical protein XNA1_3520009 [Xenorhabdus nematophila str. Anatoliense]CEE96042.1 hypothetical protein XNA1_940010 [Xenorhabdus nematophila str. Anatoliense]CEF29449.1 hypothetical protein XNW1_1770008 [Xenorhabdus nematophila str. Websteri]CEF34038.1 hypothetical protein XNW1_760008 [Xenorhabdus nematophila str. Websteri]